MKDLFTLIQEQGGTVTKSSDVYPWIKLEHPVWGGITSNHWPDGTDSLFEIIRWGKEHVAAPWRITLTPSEAANIWRTLSLIDQAVIWVNRPADVEPGWMLSLAGIDIYETLLPTSPTP